MLHLLRQLLFTITQLIVSILIKFTLVDLPPSPHPAVLPDGYIGGRGRRGAGQGVEGGGVDVGGSGGVGDGAGDVVDRGAREGGVTIWVSYSGVGDFSFPSSWGITSLSSLLDPDAWMRAGAGEWRVGEPFLFLGSRMMMGRGEGRLGG